MKTVKKDEKTILQEAIKEKEYQIFKAALESMDYKDLMIAQVFYLKDIKDRLDDIKDFLCQK